MAAILTEDDFQDPDDPAVQLAQAREARIARAVRDGLDAMAEAIKTAPSNLLFSLATLIPVIGAPNVRDALLAAYKPIAETYTDAAELETAKYGGLVVYDPLAAAGQLAGAQQTFIGSILGQAADTVRAQLLASLRAGADVDEIARALQAVIGLTPRQAQAVSNFRNLLENGDGQALQRALRDRRFDPTVRAAIDDEVDLSDEQIDAMVERYAERMLAYRARTIAATESVNAVNGGIRGAYLQYVQSGRLLESEIRRHWKTVIDERLCAICASIPILNPNGVGLMEPYLSIAGPIMEPTAHVNCRCGESYDADITRLAIQQTARAA